MRVELFFTPSGLVEDDLKGKAVVVIDVLRACTVVCAAFAAGCREIIPVKSLGDGSTLLGNLDRDVVLMAGERDGYRVEGFDLGNSPYEFTEDVVKNKTVILASTNGSKAMVLGSSGTVEFAASFVNMSAVVKKLSEMSTDTVVLCSGKDSRFSLEDAICGGMIVSRLRNLITDDNDAAKVAEVLYHEHERDLLSSLRYSDHGEYLSSIGFGADIDFAAGVDTINVLPQLTDGRFLAADVS